MKYIFVIASVLLAISHGRTIENHDAYKPRVVNGTEAKLGERPFQVSLQVKSQHFCGGSIINKYWAITAAHCVNGRQPNEIIVVAGTINLKEPYQNHRAESIIVHENYKPNDSWLNDVALIKVLVAFKFSSRVQPIILPESNATIKPNSSVVVSGWGSLSFLGDLPDKLQKATIYILDSQICRAAMNGTGLTVHPSHVCANDPSMSKGECNGDSGGPLTYNGVLTGIVSWSIKDLGCASIRYPSVYVRASSYVDWIHKNTKLI